MPTKRPNKAAAPTPLPPRPPVGKLDTIVAALRHKNGATVAQLMTATGWQQHSVRGAMAGALKKRGLIVISEKVEGIRTYRLPPVQAQP